MKTLEEALRRSLAPARPDPELPAGIPCGVLVPVLEGADGAPGLLLTVRSQEVRDHKGEVSFPGGVKHEGDPDLLTTALRETEEELGLPPDGYEILGALSPVHTVVTGYSIVPFVGLVRGRPELVPSPVEIAEVVEAPIERLARVEREVTLESARGWFEYELEGSTIWGATGRIVHAFLEALRGSRWQGG